MKKTLILLMAVLLMAVLVVSCENTPTEYTVKFDLNEGTGTAPDQKVVSGNKAEKPADPKKTNAAFKFWSKDGSTEFKFDTPITEDITLKAVWQTEFKVGDIGPAGGYIFYDCDADNSNENNGAGPDNLKSSDCGWRYLEAGKSDLGEYLWGENKNITLGTETGIGKGKTNSIILSAKGDAYAAAKAVEGDIYNNGYEDWFLPSKDELNLMYENLHKKGLGSFDSTDSKGDYCSSSEYENGKMWRQFFGSGSQDYYSRNVVYPVRPARAFK